VRKEEWWRCRQPILEGCRRTAKDRSGTRWSRGRAARKAHWWRWCQPTLAGSTRTGGGQLGSRWSCDRATLNMRQVRPMTLRSDQQGGAVYGRWSKRKRRGLPPAPFVAGRGRKHNVRCCVDREPRPQPFRQGGPRGGREVDVGRGGRGASERGRARLHARAT